MAIIVERQVQLQLWHDIVVMDLMGPMDLMEVIEATDRMEAMEVMVHIDRMVPMEVTEAMVRMEVGGKNQTLGVLGNIYSIYAKRTSSSGYHYRSCV